MPDNLVEAVQGETDPSALPNPVPPQAYIEVTLKRTAQHGPVLSINCREFHEYLRKLHVTEDTRSFIGGPVGRTHTMMYVTNNNGMQLMPAALLVKQYPYDIRIADYLSGSATPEQLKALVATIPAVARQIVEHFRPIEIKMRLVDKK